MGGGRGNACGGGVLQARSEETRGQAPLLSFLGFGMKGRLPAADALPGAA